MQRYFILSLAIVGSYAYAMDTQSPPFVSFKNDKKIQKKIAEIDAMEYKLASLKSDLRSLITNENRDYGFMMESMGWRDEAMMRKVIESLKNYFLLKKQTNKHSQNGTNSHSPEFDPYN